MLKVDISLDEASSALRSMTNNNSPGSDRFIAEFFKVFWLQLGAFVVTSLNERFRRQELLPPQKEGVIMCIPKGDKAIKTLHKNWRPISLLTFVYKIESAYIANRIECVLPYLINEVQTDFMTYLFIGDDIRLMYDLITYVNNNKMSGLLLCLDFEKAFDSLDWGLMVKVLHAFGFGSDNYMSVGQNVL